MLFTGSRWRACCQSGETHPLVPRVQTKPFCGQEAGLGSAVEQFHGQLGKASDTFQLKREVSIWNAVKGSPPHIRCRAGGENPRVPFQL